jgi:hypothetical protein
VWVALIVSSCCLALAAVVPRTYTSTALVRVSPIVPKVSIPLDLIPGPPSPALMNAIATQPRFAAGVTADLRGELLFIRCTASNVGTAQRGAGAAATAVLNAPLLGDSAATPTESLAQYRVSVLSSGDRPLRPDPTGQRYLIAAAVAAGAGLILFIVALLRFLIRAAQDDARSAVERMLGDPQRADGPA